MFFVSSCSALLKINLTLIKEVLQKVHAIIFKQKFFLIIMTKKHIKKF